MSIKSVMAGDFSIDPKSISNGDELKEFIVDSNDVVEIKLVRESSDIDDETKTFKPDMSHQIFGESEQIFGFKGLKIKLFYSATKLTTYLSHSYDEVVDPEHFDGVKADDVIKQVAEKIPPGYLSNLDFFSQSLDKDRMFKPFGDLVHRFTVRNDSGSEENVYEIYNHDISPNGFFDYHERLQTFLLWFVDSSSFIDVDDERWRFFLVYEKYMVNGTPNYAIVGYATVYEYYAYPQNVRPRISQMLVFPPFQGLGVGAEMIQTIYQKYRKNNNVLDITVEDPSENFQRLRDLVDCRLCMKLKSLKFAELPKLENHILDYVQKELKLNKKQIRRVFEILKLKSLNKNDDKAYREYRLMVKNRLNCIFRKEDNDLKKLNKIKKVLSPEEVNAALTMTSKEQRIQTLDTLYSELEDQYENVVEKLEIA